MLPAAWYLLAEIERGYQEVKSRFIERELLSINESKLLMPKIILRVSASRENKNRLPKIPGEVKSPK